MPFKSTAQKSWMFANHPRMAKQWAADTPKGKKLPRRIGGAKKSKVAYNRMKKRNETRQTA